MSILFAGWIKAPYKHKKKLRALGIKGKMIWKCDEDGEGIFEYCDATADVVRRCINEIPDFYPGAFTGIDTETDEQLPAECQIFWRWEKFEALLKDRGIWNQRS